MRRLIIVGKTLKKSHSKNKPVKVRVAVSPTSRVLAKVMGVENMTRVSDRLRAVPIRRPSVIDLSNRFFPAIITFTDERPDGEPDL